MKSLKSEIDELKSQRKVRITLRDNYNRFKNKYAKSSEMYDLYYHGYKQNKKLVKELNGEIRKLQKEYDALKDLQDKLDNKNYKDIKQGDYEDLPLFDGNVGKTGCGMIAGVIAVSMLGSHVDAHDAYEYFNRPENEFGLLFWYNDTNAVSNQAVLSYVSMNGYNFTSADLYEVEPNTVDIVSFQRNDGSRHFMCQTTDANSNIEVYNDYGIYKSYEDFVKKENIDFMFNRTIFNK